MKMSHSCVEAIFLPSGKFTTIGLVVMRLLWTFAVSIIKMDDAPVSAIACELSMRAFVAESAISGVRPLLAERALDVAMLVGYDG